MSINAAAAVFSQGQHCSVSLKGECFPRKFSVLFQQASLKGVSLEVSLKR